MAAAVELKGDWSSEEFRQLAAKAKDANQARRLLALAAIRDGRGRAEAARIGGMDRQTLRDWVHALNARGGRSGRACRIDRFDENLACPARPSFAGFFGRCFRSIVECAVTGMVGEPGARPEDGAGRFAPAQMADQREWVLATATSLMVMPIAGCRDTERALSPEPEALGGVGDGRVPEISSNGRGPGAQATSLFGGEIIRHDAAPRHGTWPLGSTRANSSGNRKIFTRRRAGLTEHLIDTVPLRGFVWEPCAGDGALATLLVDAGYKVTASDLMWRDGGPQSGHRRR